MLRPIRFLSIKDFKNFVVMLEKRSIIQVEPDLKYPEKKLCLSFKEKNSCEFIIAKDGKTYCLSDIFALNFNEASNIDIEFLTTKNEVHSIKATHIFTHKHSLEELELVYNKALFNALDQLKIQRNTKTTKTDLFSQVYIGTLLDFNRDICPINHNEIAIPGNTRLGRIYYEYPTLSTYILKQHKDPLLLHPTNATEIFINISLADLFWLSFAQRQKTIESFKLSKSAKAIAEIDNTQEFNKDILVTKIHWLQILNELMCDSLEVAKQVINDENELLEKIHKHLGELKATHYKLKTELEYAGLSHMKFDWQLANLTIDLKKLKNEYAKMDSVSRLRLGLFVTMFSIFITSVVMIPLIPPIAVVGILAVFIVYMIGDSFCANILRSRSEPKKTLLGNQISQKTAEHSTLTQEQKALTNKQVLYKKISDQITEIKPTRQRIKTVTRYHQRYLNSSVTMFPAKTNDFLARKDETLHLYRAHLP